MPDDDRYEWTDLVTWDGKVIRTIGRCLHTETVDVVSGGELVAHLCLVCDRQLDAAPRSAYA